MNENTNEVSGRRALQIAVLETADGIIAIPYGAADRQNTVRISGVSPDAGTEITLLLDGSDASVIFSADESGAVARMGFIALDSGVLNAVLTIKRRGRASLTQAIPLEVRDGCLVAPDTVRPETLASLMSELAKLKGINRKTQKRLRAIERSLGDFAWI